MWMLSSSMLALQSRPVGQTPIYDQLRGERIDVDVPPSDVDLDRLAAAGRHRLDADTPSPAAVIVRSSGPGTDRLASHRGRGPHAVCAPKAHARAVPQHAGPALAPAAGRPLAAPAAAAGGAASGIQAVGAGCRVEGTDPRPAAAPEAVFSWFGAVRIS